MATDMTLNEFIAAKGYVGWAVLKRRTSQRADRIRARYWEPEKVGIFTPKEFAAIKAEFVAAGGNHAYA